MERYAIREDACDGRTPATRVALTRRRVLTARRRDQELANRTRSERSCIGRKLKRPNVSSHTVTTTSITWSTHLRLTNILDAVLDACNH